MALTTHVQLPRTIQVGPFTYTLSRADHVDSDRCLAECDNRLRRIIFAEGIDSRRLPITLIHELIHAAAYAYGCELKEQQVTVLANGLAQALQSAGLLPKEAILEGETPE